MHDRIRTLFRSAFTNLSWWKRRLLQLALVLGAVGIGFQGWALVRGEGFASDWSWSALRAGGGCLLGFLAGASVRLFLKLGLFLAAGVALLVFGLSWMGWIDAPWSSVGEAASALSEGLSRQSASLHDFLRGLLPVSGMSALGLFAGATQRPRLDADDA